MKLLIEFRDDDHPLEKPEAEALIEEIRAALPPDASVSLRERRPGFGELGSLAHLWQAVLELANSPQALAAGGGAAIASALRPIFKILEKRQERKIILKGPGFELQGPASMFSDRTGDLIDRVEDAIRSKEKGGASRPARSAASAPKKSQTRKPPAKKPAAKEPTAGKSPSRGNKKK